MLQGVREEFVHLRNTARDAEVDCPVTDFDDETAKDVGVDLSGM